jgi:ribosome maturation protein SDO1
MDAQLLCKVTECIKILQTQSSLPIQRARMRVRITIPLEEGKQLRDRIIEDAETVEVDDMGQNGWEAVSFA